MKTNYSMRYIFTRSFIVLIFFMFAYTARSQQQTMYSQYMFNMININPAYVGNTAGVSTLSLLYRRQWVGIDGSPTTTSLSFDTRKDSSKIGYGLQVYNDKIGIENTSGVQAFYSFRVPFDNSALTIGLSGGVLNYQANFTKVNTIQAGDPAFMQDIRGMLPTAGAGILYERRKWYASLSVPSLLRSKLNAAKKAEVTSNGAENHYYFSTGYLFQVDENVLVKPSILLKAVSGAPLQADLNINAQFYNLIQVGFSYRTSDSFIGLIELNLNHNLWLGYAYDYTTTFIAYGRASHELMLRLNLNKK
ncbi:MAG: putative rane protein [Chitinophagaceae bacterium]|nr:putative rane protein [Chitinophagaceae bacterium]